LNQNVLVETEESCTGDPAKEQEMSSCSKCAMNIEVLNA
jgi:hypothetical protein